MRTFVWIAVIALSPLHVAAEADPSAAAPEPTKAATKSLYEKQVRCTYQSPVGSRIARKTCRTRAQSDADSANAQDKMRELGQAADRNAVMSPGSQPIR